MKKYLLVALLSLLSFYGFAQEHSQKPLAFTEADKTMTEYPLDKGAEAVVLFDIGVATFIEDDDKQHTVKILFEKSKRVKILKEAGLKYAEVEIAYYSTKKKPEIISQIKATTYNIENGELTETSLENINIFEERIGENWSVIRFAFPNVQPGSIIEYSYLLETPYKFNLPNWNFQQKIPTVYSKYVLKEHPNFKYMFNLNGASKFDSTISYQERLLPNYGANFKGKFSYINQSFVHKFMMFDVPAFKDETFISSVKDYVIKLDFQMSAYHYVIGGPKPIKATWKQLNKELLEHENFGKFQKSCKKHVSKAIRKHDVLSLSEYERYNFIVRYVKNNFTWSGYDSKYASQSLKELVKTKTGNSAEMNLFLTEMLIAAKIDAKPVIISTRNHGKISLTYPFVNFFNAVVVIATINGKQVLADATEASSASNMLSERCINEKRFNC